MPYIHSNRQSRKYYNKAKTRWHASVCIKEQDHFGLEVPSFNIGGETTINTLPGGFLTLIILGITLGYAILKFIDLSQGNDPNVRQSVVRDYNDPSEELFLADETNFRIAVGGRLFSKDGN